MKPTPLGDHPVLGNEAMRELATALDLHLPKGFGFTVFVFELSKEGGRLSYVSNADRADMINTIREWLLTQKD